MRPERAVRPALEADSPELLDDLISILELPTSLYKGGENQPGNGVEIRALTLSLLETRGIRLPGLPEWQPFDPALQGPKADRYQPVND